VTKKATLIIASMVLIAIVGGFLYWQMSQLGKGLRIEPSKDAEEVLVSAFSVVALAPGTDGNVSQYEGLLDQYQKNPALTHQRYLLVITWMHAGQIFKAIGNNPPSEGKIFSSAIVSSIPQKDRVDGWGNSYCVFADSNQMAFLSSGGNGALICEKMQQVAKQAVNNSHDSRLTKVGSFLIVVFRQAGDARLIRPQPDSSHQVIHAKQP
jgi:hypothetical protein